MYAMPLQHDFGNKRQTVVLGVKSFTDFEAPFVSMS